MSDLSFFVPGKAAAQGSKRHVGRGVMVEMSKDLPAWRTAVANTARAAHQGRPPIDGPVAVAMTVYLAKPRTTKFKTYPAGPPDIDKLCRAVLDSLTISQVIQDDARVVKLSARKEWADTKIGAQITVELV